MKDDYTNFKKMFDMVRLVDPKTSRIINLTTHEKSGSGKCFDFWQREEVCENCISMRAYHTGESAVKIEVANGEIFLILAAVVDDDGRYVLEGVKNITESGLVWDARGMEAADLILKTAELNRLVVRDYLTDCYNKRYLMEHLVYDISAARVNGNPLGIAMIDIDLFKATNDAHGHLAGDELLIQLVNLLQESKTDDDWLARFGGEEFALVLRGKEKEECHLLLEGVRSAVEQHIFTAHGKEFRLTISIGLSMLTPNIETGKDMLAGADRNLYLAKKAGRNNVTV